MDGPKSTFEDLDVWRMSRELRQRFAQFARLLPSDERYRLADQVVRASRSITANLAEGYGRYHFQENIQYCRQARGSLYELIDHLTVALDEKYINECDFQDLRTTIHTIVRKLNGYIDYLSKQKNKLNHSP